MAYRLSLILTILSLLQATAAYTGELYLMAFINPNMAARADGGNPKSGIGIFQPMKLVDGLVLSARVEALFDGRDRDGGKHPVSVRYTVRLQYDYDPYFVAVERFAWNPITHVTQLPAGQKDMIGGSDTMSSWLIKTGVRW